MSMEKYNSNCKDLQIVLQKLFYESGYLKSNDCLREVKLIFDDDDDDSDDDCKVYFDCDSENHKSAVSLIESKYSSCIDDLDEDYILREFYNSGEFYNDFTDKDLVRLETNFQIENARTLVRQLYEPYKYLNYLLSPVVRNGCLQLVPTSSRSEVYFCDGDFRVELESNDLVEVLYFDVESKTLQWGLFIVDFSQSPISCYYYAFLNRFPQKWGRIEIFSGMKARLRKYQHNDLHRFLENLEHKNEKEQEQEQQEQ